MSAVIAHLRAIRIDGISSKEPLAYFDRAAFSDK